MLKLAFCALLLLCAILQSSSGAAAEVAADDHQGPAPAASRTYIVRMNAQEKPLVFSDHKSWYESTLRASLESSSDSQQQQQQLVHLYQTVFHGFAAKLTPSQARAIQSAPGFMHMFPDTAKHLHTTYSPEFLHLDEQNITRSINKGRSRTEDAEGEIWKESWYGSDSIIGIFDTGIWPQSHSFSDRKMSPVPKRWNGTCQGGPGFNRKLCNRKLIGARFLSRGYEAATGPFNSSREYESPRDSDGHGTHTASTAAGRDVYSANLFGFAQGTARGMAPRARIAAYKVCWESGCFDSDILAAFEFAIRDGVDVISLSVGGGVMPYYMDSIAIGSFAAARSGIFVACSGGNEGPTDLTVTNVAPWITTVGASTMDRSFPANVLLGNGKILRGVSLYSGSGLPHGKQLSLVNPNDSYSASLCMSNSLDKKLVTGKIVFCERGSNPRVEKGYNVAKAGGIGMILANGVTDGEGLVADSHVLPATAVGASSGNIIRSYLANARHPTATISFRGTVFGSNPAPVVASFSSRGPNPETPEILKPDVVAPGVNILAAWTGDAGPTGLSADTRRVSFNIISGTSMACPHVSGLAALLKAAHPTWSPAAVRSALMTSASVAERSGRVIADEATSNASTPFDFGAGHVDPERAVDPGLVYDMGLRDYEGFLCGLNYSARAREILSRKQYSCEDLKKRGIPFQASELNYPSFSVLFDQSDDGKLSTTISRTVTNVGPDACSYNATVVAPRGVKISVQPSRLEFRKKLQKLRFRVTISTRRSASLGRGESETIFGRLIWRSVRSHHIVQSPIAISKQQPY